MGFYFTVHEDDDFFLLGGNSLSAIQLVALSGKAGVVIELEGLFQHPVFKNFCAHCTQTIAPRKQPVVTTGPAPFTLLKNGDKILLPANVEDAYPASQLQLGMLYEGLLSDGTTYLDITMRKVGLPLELAVFKKALSFMTQRHPILRTKFAFSGYSSPLQLVERQVETRPFLILMELHYP